MKTKPRPPSAIADFTAWKSDRPAASISTTSPSITAERQRSMLVAP